MFGGMHLFMYMTPNRGTGKEMNKRIYENRRRSGNRGNYLNDPRISSSS